MSARRALLALTSLFTPGSTRPLEGPEGPEVWAYQAVITLLPPRCRDPQARAQLLPSQRNVGGGGALAREGRGEAEANPARGSSTLEQEAAVPLPAAVSASHTLPQYKASPASPCGQ
ncbi:hypothetical protein NDU88_007217 [Pleurodeles waltl]|uniref:Uncharacterized protein n=1 Tax=Pleurodeles waltl TaxID=8319 RepID=A0AAV7NSG8_PLEWA|nr:hypothetical protein NDU88_007217 [Pleurodeles waltl]